MTKPTKTQIAVSAVPAHLWEQGCVLAVDPSSGSANSMPAYALADKGTVVDSGVIELPLTKRQLIQEANAFDIPPEFLAQYTHTGTVPLQIRLYLLREKLHALTLRPDILCLESIPPFMESRGGGGFRNNGVVHLHQSVGTIISAYPWANQVPVAIPSHQALMKKLTNGCYLKSDENDALSIITCAFRQAGFPLKNEQQVIDVVTGRKE